MLGTALAAATMLSIGGAGGSASAVAAPDQWNSVAGVFAGGGGGSEIDAMAVIGTDLYIAGSFTSIGGLPVGNIARFDGQQWSTVGDPSNGPATTTANALVAVGTDLYVAGPGGAWKFDTVSQTWTDLVIDPDLNAIALAWYDDGTNPAYLVAAGISLSGDTCSLKKYDGSIWTTLGDPTLALPTPGNGGWNACFLESLAVWNDDLYIGGVFDHVGLVTAYSIARFDGTVFHAVGSGGGNGVFEASMAGIDAIPVGDVSTMAVNPAGTALVIGGGFTDVNLTIDATDPSAILGQGTDRAENLAVWDGTTLAPFGGSDDPAVFPSASEYVANLFFASDGSLYLAGGTTFPDGSYGIGRLADPTGTDWSSLGFGVDDDALAVQELGDSIWVGGFFTAAYADDAPTEVLGTATIARWGIPHVAASIAASSVTGTPVVGNTLRLTLTLRGSPAPVVTRQWLRCTDQVALAIAPANAQPRRLLPPGCVEISGATGATYVVQPADVGKYLVVVVMASNALGISAALPSTAVRATAAPAAPTTTEPNFVLPATGSSNDSVSWTALVMVLAGLALLVPARRRWLR